MSWSVQDSHNIFPMIHLDASDLLYGALEIYLLTLLTFSASLERLLGRSLPE